MYKPNGYLGLTNSLAIEISLNKAHDGLVYWYSDEYIPDKPSDETPILTDENGDFYFLTDGSVQYYLRDFLKV